MSLTVPAPLLEQAQAGEIQPQDFLVCIKNSLPYAWQLIEELAGRLSQTTASFVDNQIPPPDEQARGQLLRVLASDAMRGALEAHFGVKLAFQNCHRVALFRKDQLDQTYEAFISPRSQILNQKPELVDC
ncbi:MAG TPA: SCO5389 family protein [Ktedonobacteraceae bacterium]|nr:SCO5389 family protein [Ktedonobacteraceae bacterium]